MQLREVLLEASKDAIDLILSQSTLDRASVQSRYRVADSLIRSMVSSKVKDPENTVIYGIAKELKQLREHGNWPKTGPALVHHLAQKVNCPVSSVRSSLRNFPWFLPAHLRPQQQWHSGGTNGKKPVAVESRPEEPPSLSGQEDRLQVSSEFRPYSIVIQVGEVRIEIKGERG